VRAVGYALGVLLAVAPFHLRPQINTRYQLRLTRHPEVRSRELKVHVDLRGRLVASLPAPGTTEVRYTAQARVPVTRADGRVHFYLHEDGRGPLRRVATGRPRQAGVNAIVVTARFPDPDPRNSDRFVSCAVGLLAEGFGHPSPSEPECGNRVMAATKRRLNAPG
jgi:YD repeat-containing protein